MKSTPLNPTEKLASTDSLVQPARAVASTGDCLRIDVSVDVEDRSWDNFLASSAGGHHVQTSLWGQLKASIGWRSVRIVMRKADRIVGGAQMLLRPVPLLGAVAYVPKGPVLASQCEDMVADLFDALHRVAKQNRVRFLIVQPPNDGHHLCDTLTEMGFHSSSIEAFPVGTTSLRLDRPEEEILAGMKSKTRYNIRLGLRKGLVVREGSADDLPTVFHILASTANRQSFQEYSLEYFQTMRAVFEPHGHFKLFLAEHEGEALSALLAVPFGDTVLFKKGGWSGRCGNLHPNEGMHWAAIQWAKREGYKVYDFEGIESETARSIVQGTDPAAHRPNSVTRFKLGFGGDVSVHPGSWEHTYNPALRLVRELTSRRWASTSMTTILTNFNRR